MQVSEAWGCVLGENIFHTSVMEVIETNTHEVVWYNKNISLELSYMLFSSKFKY